MPIQDQMKPKLQKDEKKQGQTTEKTSKLTTGVEKPKLRCPFCGRTNCETVTLMKLMSRM